MVSALVNISASGAGKVGNTWFRLIRSITSAGLVGGWVRGQ
ncbi:hypothetical protein ACQP00_20250 [Dactylosporangium sp. CS-047395]